MMFGKSRLSEGNTSHSTAVLRSLDGASQSTVRHSQPPQPSVMIRPIGPAELAQTMNPETLKFLNKYFPRYYQQDLPLNSFVSAILKEFEGLWTPEQALQVQTHFIKKLAEMLEANTHVSIIKLTTTTRDNGMIGLILSVFRELKKEQDTRNPQSQLSFNLDSCKDVLQEYLESLYIAIERQMYARFNNEMRRMIIKYKETDKMLKRINELINEHSDVIDFGRRAATMKKQFEDERQQFTKEVNRLQLTLEREQLENESLSKQVIRLTNENEKLNNRVDRLQEIVAVGAYRNMEAPSVACHSKQQLLDPPEEFIPRHNTTTRNRGLSFFVSDDKTVCLGGKSQTASRSRLSHPNKENIMDVANRPVSRMLI